MLYVNVFNEVSVQNQTTHWSIDKLDLTTPTRTPTMDLVWVPALIVLDTYPDM